MDHAKVIDKICKCLRLSESGNPYEAALALRQAHRLMAAYGVSESELATARVTESGLDAGDAYSPPFWRLALANLVADAFDCRVLVQRRYGRRPAYRFLGLEYAPEVATYTFDVLLRQLEQARVEFCASLTDRDEAEQTRRGDVFCQAWLFRVGRTVADFAGNPAARAAVDAHIQAEYGETADLLREPVAPAADDYEDILSGMRAAHGVSLLRSMRNRRPVRGLIKAQA